MYENRKIKSVYYWVKKGEEGIVWLLNLDKILSLSWNKIYVYVFLCDFKEII